MWPLRERPLTSRNTLQGPGALCRKRRGAIWVIVINVTSSMPKEEEVRCSNVGQKSGDWGCQRDTTWEGLHPSGHVAGSEGGGRGSMSRGMQPASSSGDDLQERACKWRPQPTATWHRTLPKWTSVGGNASLRECSLGLQKGRQPCQCLQLGLVRPKAETQLTTRDLDF